MTKAELAAGFEALKVKSEQQEQTLRELSERIGKAAYEDGPRAPRFFLWQGRIAILSPEQFRLAHGVWQSPERHRNRRELAIEMYDDEERAGYTMKNISDKLTKALERGGIPIVFEPVGNEIWAHYPESQ